MSMLHLQHQQKNLSAYQRKRKSVFNDQFIGPITIRKSKALALNLLKKRKNVKINGLNNFNLHNEENENALTEICNQQHKRKRLTLNEKTNTNHSFSNFNSFQYREDINEIGVKVPVPSWRVRNYSASFKLEKTENLNDDTFLKRHQKPENEEKQIKRWDIRRQREAYERNKLLKGRSGNIQNISENNHTNIDKCVIKIINDSPIKLKSIKIVPETKDSIFNNKTNNTELTNSKKRLKYLTTDSEIFATKQNEIVKTNVSLPNFENESILNVYDFDFDSDSNIYFNFKKSTLK